MGTFSKPKLTYDYIIFFPEEDEQAANTIHNYLRVEHNLIGCLQTDTCYGTSVISGPLELAQECRILFFLVTDNFVSDDKVIMCKDDQICSAIQNLEYEKYHPLIPLLLKPKTELKTRNHSAFAGLMSRVAYVFKGQYFDHKIRKFTEMLDDKYGIPEMRRRNARSDQQLNSDHCRNALNDQTHLAQMIDHDGASPTKRESTQTESTDKCFENEEEEPDKSSDATTTDLSRGDEQQETRDQSNQTSHDQSKQIPPDQSKQTSRDDNNTRDQVPAEPSLLVKNSPGAIPDTDVKEPIESRMRALQIDEEFWVKDDSVSFEAAQTDEKGASSSETASPSKCESNNNKETVAKRTFSQDDDIGTDSPISPDVEGKSPWQDPKRAPGPQPLDSTATTESDDVRMTQSTSSGDDIETDDAGCHNEQAHVSDIGLPVSPKLGEQRNTVNLRNQLESADNVLHSCDKNETSDKQPKDKELAQPLSQQDLACDAPTPFSAPKCALEFTKAFNKCQSADIDIIADRLVTMNIFTQSERHVLNMDENTAEKNKKDSFLDILLNKEDLLTESNLDTLMRMCRFQTEYRPANGIHQTTLRILSTYLQLKIQNTESVAWGLFAGEILMQTEWHECCRLHENPSKANERLLHYLSKKNDEKMVEFALNIIKGHVSKRCREYITMTIESLKEGKAPPECCSRLEHLSVDEVAKAIRSPLQTSLIKTSETIINTITDLDSLISTLFTKDVLSYQQFESLQDISITTKKARALMAELFKGEKEEVEAFVCVLEQGTGSNPEIARMIRSESE